MDIKAIVLSPKDAIEEHWASVETCDVSESIFSLASEIKLVTAEIKATKSKKQLCARAFKAADAEPDVVASLKAQMKAISSELKALEKKRKANEQQLRAYFEARDPTDELSGLESIAKPRQFMIASNVADSTINISSISV